MIFTLLNKLSDLYWKKGREVTTQLSEEELRTKLICLFTEDKNNTWRNTEGRFIDDLQFTLTTQPEFGYIRWNSNKSVTLKGKISLQQPELVTVSYTIEANTIYLVGPVIVSVFGLVVMNDSGLFWWTCGLSVLIVPNYGLYLRNLLEKRFLHCIKSKSS